MFLEIVFLLVCLSGDWIDAQADCTGKPDGPYGAGCHSYTLCTDGRGVTIECPLPFFAYNELIGDCDLIVDTPPPCGNQNDCSQLPDNGYPDMTEGQECLFFFTCLGGINVGNIPCNAPGTSGLCFHFTPQVCDYIYNVPPPCGTNVTYIE